MTIGGRGRRQEERRRQLLASTATVVADTMFALSTPSRVQLLLSLMDGPRTVGELTEGLEMEQSAVSHQLRVLREHGLVRAERIGRTRVYSLQDEHVLDVLHAVLAHVEVRVPGVRRRGLLGGAAQ